MQVLREAAAQALREGNREAALDCARRALPDPRLRLSCRRLLKVEQAPGAPGILEQARLEDVEVRSSANLIEGALQFPLWGEPFRPPVVRLLEISDAEAIFPSVVTDSQGALLDDNIGFPNSELWRHPGVGTAVFAASDADALLAQADVPAARFDEPVYYLPADANYAAWWLGCVARLALYPGADGPKLLLHGRPLPFHRESLQLLRVPQEAVVEVDARIPVKAKTLLFPTSTFVRHTPSASAIAFLRSRLGVALTPPPRERPDYLARIALTTSRPLLNETETIALLQSLGFDILEPQRHSVASQARSLAGARALAGAYGANLANALFAPAGGRALVIATKGQPEFARLLSVCGIDFWHVVPEAIQIRQDPTYSGAMGFRVDLDELRAFAARVLD